MIEYEEGIPGNDFSATAFFAAEKVMSGRTDMTDATVANAYATLALAQEARLQTLATLSNSSDRQIADRAWGELIELLGWRE